MISFDSSFDPTYGPEADIMAVIVLPKTSYRNLLICANITSGQGTSLAQSRVLKSSNSHAIIVRQMY